MTHDINFDQYDKTVIAFSGGKDSLATVLLAKKLGLPSIELWHHLVDGTDSNLMDWPVTTSYCKAVAKALELPIYFSWKEGGFEGEMLRENARTKPVHFETPGGNIVSVGGTRGNLSTRLKFPMATAELQKRWCSAYLKIDVGAKIFTNDLRFRNSKTLFITGERAQESAGRAKYNQFEPHKCDKRNSPKLKRHIDHWRPIHQWKSEEVWAIIQEFQINPHPAYLLGWGRTSCLNCIFGSCNQWATIQAIAPKMFAKIVEYEKIFGLTIQQRSKVQAKKLFGKEAISNWEEEGKPTDWEPETGFASPLAISVEELANMGTPYPEAINNPGLVKIALSDNYSLPVITEAWELPAGAFGEQNGSV